jgi:large subunit ribosomal protein L28
VSTQALRSVDHNGGIDAFLTKARAENLSAKARQLKAAIIKKQAASAA